MTRYIILLFLIVGCNANSQLYDIKLVSDSIKQIVNDHKDIEILINNAGLLMIICFYVEVNIFAST